MERFVGRSSFRVADNVLVSALVASPETIAVTATREPFDCFLSTYRIKAMLDKVKGTAGDAASFVTSFLRSFDETAPLAFAGSSSPLNPHLNSRGGGTAAEKLASSQLVRVVPQSSSSSVASAPGSKPTLTLRVTVLWTPRLSSLQTVENACSFDLHLVKVQENARDSFAWQLLNSCCRAVQRLSAAAHRSGKLDALEAEEEEQAQQRKRSPQKPLHQQQQQQRLAEVAASKALSKHHS